MPVCPCFCLLGLCQGEERKEEGRGEEGGCRAELRTHATRISIRPEGHTATQSCHPHMEAWSTHTHTHTHGNTVPAVTQGHLIRILFKCISFDLVWLLFLSFLFCDYFKQTFDNDDDSHGVVSDNGWYLWWSWWRWRGCQSMAELWWRPCVRPQGCYVYCSQASSHKAPQTLTHITQDLTMVCECVSVCVCVCVCVCECVSVSTCVYVREKGGAVVRQILCEHAAWVSVRSRGHTERPPTEQNIDTAQTVRRQ